MGRLVTEVAADQASYDAAVAKHVGSARILALFCGEEDAAGHSWCPDCVAADPILHAAFDAEAASSAGDLVVIRVPLNRAEYKGNMSHWARVHKRVRLQRIPTLVKLTADGTLLDALIEGMCAVPEDVKTFVSGDYE